MPCHCEVVAKVICDHKTGGAPKWKQSDPAQWLLSPAGPVELAKLYTSALGNDFDVVNQAPAADCLAKTLLADFAGDSLINMGRFCNAFTGGTYDDGTGTPAAVFLDAAGAPVQIDVPRWSAAGMARNHAIGHVPVGTGEPELSVPLYEQLRDACLNLLSDSVFLTMPASSRDGPAAAITAIGNINDRSLQASTADIKALEQRIQIDQQQMLQAIKAEVRSLNTTVEDQVQQMKDELNAKFDSESKSFNEQVNQHLALGQNIALDVDAMRRQHQEKHDAGMQRLDDVSTAMSTDMQRAAQLLTELNDTSDRQFEQVKDIARTAAALLNDLERATLQVNSMMSMMRAEHERTRHRVDQSATRVQLHTATVAVADSAANKRFEADLLAIDAEANQKKQAKLREAADIDEMKLADLRQLASGLEVKGDKRTRQVYIDAIKSKQSEVAPVEAYASVWHVGAISSWGRKGFGYIKPDGGGEAVFCHIKALNSSILRGSLEPTIGARVAFSTEPGNKGPRVAQTRTVPPFESTPGVGFVASGESAARRSPEVQQHCAFGLGCKTYGCQHVHPHGRPNDCKHGTRCRFIGTTNPSGYPCRFLHPGDSHVNVTDRGPSPQHQQYIAPPGIAPRQNDDTANELHR